jgi:predicted ATP-binding protein involved in virulence
MAENRKASTKPRKAGGKSKASGKKQTRSKKKVAPTAEAVTPPPAYFRSLTIENVRCFGPKQTLDLSDGKGRPAQWTIILGNNGVGKTTILHSLVAITPAEDQFSQAKKFVEPKGTQGLIFDETGNFRRLGNLNLELLISAAFVIGSKLTENNNGEYIEDFSFIDYGSSQRWSLEKYERLGNIQCFGYGASRRMGETSLSEKGEDHPFASLFSEDVALINGEEWLLQADYAAHTAKDAVIRRRARKRRDDIKEVLIKLLPEVTDIRFGQLTKEQLKPRVEVETPYGWVSIKDLSLGYKTLIAWMVDFASRMFDLYPESADPLAEPAVVLVDEIDLHLHPKWQRELIKFLSELFPNTQFIATTHSPLVVQAATDANLVVLRREGDHVVIDNDVESVEGWRVDQILTGEPFELESARPPKYDELLAARRAILSKSRLNTKDKARLRDIEAEIGDLPAGETPQEMKALDIIARAAARLENER